MSQNLIFNIAFWKSGTHSLNTALNILGYRSVHHVDSNNRRLSEYVEQNLANKQLLFTGLEQYNAFCDFDGYLYYQQLYHQYPNSKFIVMLRNNQDWLNSIETHKNNFVYNKDLPYLNTDWAKWKQQTLDEIQHFFADKQCVLYIDIDQDNCWQKLCDFLNKPIPDVDFPHNFKSKEFLTN